MRAPACDFTARNIGPPRWCAPGFHTLAKEGSALKFAPPRTVEKPAIKYPGEAE
ncbi:hypothetical protein SLG_16630 [Sphingobium sp. SYK-6]|nr:hypothetical protein SLG_16630 [Sphingobium sp. SYK-6]